MSRIILIIFFFSNSVFAQNIDPIYRAYRDEKKSDFEFEPFKRGFDEYWVSRSLDSLEAKKIEYWNFDDSLRLAVNLLKISLHEEALLQFSLLNTSKINDTLVFRYYIICLQSNNKFDLAKKEIKNYKNKFNNHDISTLERFIEFKHYLFENEINKKWLEKNYIIPFDFSIEDLKQDTSAYNKTLELLKLYNNELQFQTNFIHEDDQIIAAVATDMGQILELHFSLSQAYIAYSLARNYDRSNKKALENLKNVRKKMNDKKYRIPIFRRYFPKKKKGKFNYDILKEKVWEKKMPKLEPNEPLPFFDKKEKKKYEKAANKLGSDFLYLIVLSITLVLVVLFVRTKR